MPRFARHPASTFPSHAGRSYLTIIIFLCSFVLILFLVSHLFLVPAYRSYPTRTLLQQRQIRAISALLLTLLLAYLFVGLFITFRISRLFFPRRSVRSTTTYTDVWAESGKRLTIDPLPDDPTDDEIL